jgi:acetylornithine deacetylase/succinyl-diaminopimelate desuccinylase-like protein
VTSEATIHERPTELLQQLIRFDTSNPPGGERECIDWVKRLLEARGVTVQVLAQDPERPNLVARLKGTGDAPAFLLQGHVDVVPAAGKWSHPPFAAEVADGYVWGRGALDMKGGIAMMLAAFLQGADSDTPPPGDVVLCLLSDEEGGGDYGARFLVENHADLFDGVRYAIGEFGGFTMEVAGRRFYPIMVAEKQLCSLRAILRGPAGHGSLPVRHGAMGRLGRLLTALDRRRLPVHVTPPVRSMIEAIAADAPPAMRIPLRALLRPRFTDTVLDRLGQRARLFDVLLHNTASATIVRGGEAHNVIPGEVSVDLDCRLLPGFRPPDASEELRALSAVEVDFEVLRFDPGPPAADVSLFDTLGGVLRELDPSARPVPLLLPGVSDGRFFARLGIQTYGFLPMQLPDEMRSWSWSTARTSESPSTRSSSEQSRSGSYSTASARPSRPRQRPDRQYRPSPRGPGLTTALSFSRASVRQLSGLELRRFWPGEGGDYVNRRPFRRFLHLRLGSSAATVRLQRGAPTHGKARPASPGRYQFRSPSSFIVAGRSTARTMVASSTTAVAKR